MNATLQYVGLTAEQVRVAAGRLRPTDDLSELVRKYAVKLKVPFPPPKPQQSKSKLTSTICMARKRAEERGDDTSKYPPRVRGPKGKRV